MAEHEEAISPTQMRFEAPPSAPVVQVAAVGATRAEPAALAKTSSVARELLQETSQPEVVDPVELPPALDTATLSSAGG
eukprot:3155077-Prymnesium_polylepis.1